MGKKSKSLSHEEIWDDSALVDSWDAALQEYQLIDTRKLYHSIHARGERVEDVLKAAEVPEELSVNGTVDMSNMTSEYNGMPHLEEVEDGEVEDGEIEDDSIPEADTMDETTEMKVRNYRKAVFAPMLTLSEGDTRKPGTLFTPNSRGEQ
ncbi:MAG: hypothetical protein Q9171_007394 [Xanthocarpia ochracea]